MHWIPRRWTLVGVLLAMMLTMSPVAIAQVTTTEVADTIYRADGSTATGTVVISWPQFTTASGQAVPAGSTSVSIGAGGALDVELAPNAGSNPMGSYYTVVYHLDDGSVSRQYWVVPASGTPVKISAISSTVMPLSVAQQTVSKSYVDTAIAQAITGVSPGDSTVPYVLKAGDTMTGPLVLPGDPTASTQATDKHYVDTSVQQIAAGLGQKVSLLPQTTQVVAQPTGTQLEVNNLNGVEYATQYATGNGGNAIANAVTSSDCAAGCEVKVENSYGTVEGYDPSTWNDQTHVEDARLGGRRDTFINPGNRFAVGSSVGQTINLVVTKDSALNGQTLVSGDPNAVALDISTEALAGGSNFFPQLLEEVPYFKSNYSVRRDTGNYYTMGQHSLSQETINCYGVGDCLIGSQTILASGGFRDEADEGAHPYDLSFGEDPRVFTGSCSSGCSAGSTAVMVSATAAAGTQGEGRYLIDKNPAKVLSTGLLIGGALGSPYATATFSGTSFPVSVFFATAQLALSQANNIAPGTVTLAIATSGVTAGFATNTIAAPASSGVACVVDQNPIGSVAPHNYEMARYTVVDGTHLQLTLNKVHAAQATVAIGGLCGYGLEQTVDTQNGIRQVFPVVGSYSSTGLYYAGGMTQIVGQMNKTSGFLNVSATVATIARTNNVVTLTAAGNFPDVNGLTMQVSGVADSSYNGSFSVTTTGGNTLTYAQTGPDSTSANGTISILTGGYVLYPMAEVLGVMNPATKLVDGEMTLAPNTVAWAAGDAVEEPHYFQELVGIDTEFISQTTPRPSVLQSGGIEYDGTNAGGLTGWQISNHTPTTSYLGAGGTHTVPFAAYSAQGVWQNSMILDAGQQAVFNINCNYRGCDRWNSTYSLFVLQSSAGGDTIQYQPQTSTLDIDVRGAGYVFTPQSFSAATINAGTINATTINGPVSGNSITSGAVAAAYLPMLGASGSAHAAGIVPDPGAASGTTRFLREDGTWSAPTAMSAGSNALSGALADYNFLQGSGATLTDLTANHNDCTLRTGTGAPTWIASGMVFAQAQGISCPSTLNAGQTFMFAAYLPPTSNIDVNFYPGFTQSSLGGNGYNLLYTGETKQGDLIYGGYGPTIYNAANGGFSSAGNVLVSGYRVITYVLGIPGTNADRFFIDGVETDASFAQSTFGAQSSGNIYIGAAPSGPFATSGINGTLYRATVFPTQLTPAQILTASNLINADVQSRGVPTTPLLQPIGQPRLMCIGDSITNGNGYTPYCSSLSLTNQPAYTIVNDGVKLETMEAITGSEDNRAALQCKTNAGPSVATVFAGTNSFLLNGHSTPQIIFSALAGEITRLKTAGCRVFAGTMLSRGGLGGSGATFDAEKDAYDAIILASAKVSGADGVIDFAANPLLGADGAYANATYFNGGDLTHPTNAGQAILAAEMSNALNYYFGYNATNPNVVTAATYTMLAGDGYVTANPSANQTLTLPDCTGQSGAVYTVSNLQSAFTVGVVAGSSSQLINGLAVGTPVIVPSNSSVAFRDVPNPKTVAGCHWEK